MLILTRRVGEVIKIGNDISVVVLGITAGQVRLGVEAPQGVAVDREEIALRKAAGLPKPNAKITAPAQEPEPLYANRTEAEWRQMLADEQKVGSQKEVRHGV